MSTEKPETTAPPTNSRTFLPLAAAAILAMLAAPGAIDAELERRELPVPKDQEPVAKASLLLAGVRSQSDFAAQVINIVGPDIDPSDLTQALTQAFPGAKIGSRHGPHYLSHARSGKLDDHGLKPGLIIPHKRKAAPKKKAEAETEPTVLPPVPSAEELVKLHSGKDGRKQLQAMAKEHGVKAAGKNADIAGRIVEAQLAARAETTEQAA